jgi:hypothetical protein
MASWGRDRRWSHAFLLDRRRRQASQRDAFGQYLDSEEACTVNRPSIPLAFRVHPCTSTVGWSSFSLSREFARLQMTLRPAPTTGAAESRDSRRESGKHNDHHQQMDVPVPRQIVGAVSERARPQILSAFCSQHSPGGPLDSQQQQCKSSRLVGHSAPVACP